MSLGGLVEVVDELVASDPVSLADPESIETLSRQLARLDAVVARASAALDASGVWADDGAANASMWLAVRCGLPKTESRRRVRLGRALRHLPATAGAWLSGEITGAQAGAICRARTPRTEEALERDEELLVAQATRLRYEAFRQALCYWAQHADPEGAEQDAGALRDGREVWLAESYSGTFFGRMTLDPISGAIVSGELERLEQALFDADWAEAHERLGRDPVLSDLARSPGQRRADALVEMATRSSAMPEAAKRPLPLFSVLVDFETLHGRVCELAHGTPLTPGSLLPWLDQAMVERAVFGPERRVEIGSRARLFTGAVRRAIELRDRVCTHPYCDRPAAKCEVDHILPYAAGGETTQENGRLLCPFHNRLRNQRPPPAA